MVAVRHNLVGNGHSTQSKKKKGFVLVFFVTLLTLVVVLSGLAFHLSHEVLSSKKQQSVAADDSTTSKKRIDDAPTVVKEPVAELKRREVGDNDVAQLSTDSEDRVYCMIPFIWNEEMYNVIMETWGKRCDVINFLTDSEVGGVLKGDKITEGVEGYKQNWEFPEGTFPNNVMFINMTRTWHDCPVDKKGDKKVCRHIWEKMWRSWIFVADNHLNDAEWFCKVDYDTFFFPYNVKHYVRHKKWNPYSEYHYFGHKIEHRQRGREPMIAGATACWSHKTLKDVADVYRNMPHDDAKGERGKCEDRAQATEEASTSLCLKQHLNVTAYAARDDEMREHITVAKYHDVLTWNRTEQGDWWYWKGKPKQDGISIFNEMENALSINPIGLHKYKSAPEIRTMEQQFFGDSDNKEIMKLNPRTKTYVLKVRKAMGIDK